MSAAYTINIMYKINGICLGRNCLGRDEQLQWAAPVESWFVAAHLTMKRHVAVMLLAIIPSFFIYPECLFAKTENTRMMIVHIIHAWQDPGHDLTIHTEYGNLFFRDDLQSETTTSIPDGSRFVDHDGNVMKALFRCATGVAVKIYVGTVEQGRIIGIEDFEGRLWMVEALP